MTKTMDSRTKNGKFSLEKTLKRLQMCRKACEPFIPDGVSEFIKVRHYGFQIVVQNDFRTPAEVFGGPNMAAPQAL